MTQRRAIILTHPMFDEPGHKGSEMAKNYAQLLIKNFELSLKQLEIDNAPPQAIEQMASEINQFGIKVRLVPEDL